MSRDLELDPRAFDLDSDRRSSPEIDRPDPGRGGRSAVDPRDRLDDADPRNVFARGLDLPRGPGREHVYIHGHIYRLRGSEVRMMATVGAFRVVALRDLRDDSRRVPRADTGDAYSLRRAGLLRTVAPMLGRESNTVLVALTRRGRALLDAHRHDGRQPRQTFYAGAARPRELVHDAHVYRAYLRAAERLTREGLHVRRVCLDHELKSEYQRFLQAGNRGRADSDGRPTRDLADIRAWAGEHQLPMFDGHVHFPDLRIEYETPEGRWAMEDIEVETMHYRGAHAAAKARAGFTRYRIAGNSSSGRARPFDPKVAEGFL
jgi:hypothetical protein